MSSGEHILSLVRKVSDIVYNPNEILQDVELSSALGGWASAISDVQRAVHRFQLLPHSLHINIPV